MRFWIACDIVVSTVPRCLRVMSTYSPSCRDLGDLSLAADDKLGLGVVEKLV